MRIIDMLWDEDWKLSELASYRPPEYHRITSRRDEAEKKLLNVLDEEGKKLLTEYRINKNALQTAAQKGAFLSGFRLGVSLILEAMEE